MGWEMKDINRLIKLYNEVRDYLASKGTNMYNFFIGGLKNGKELWNDIKPMIESYLVDVDGEIPTYQDVTITQMGDLAEGLNGRDWSILTTCLRTVIMRYCTFDGKTLEENDEEHFELPSVVDRPITSANIAYIKNKCKDYDSSEKELCLLILPTGKTYYAVNDDHASLAYWLNINGIDFKNSLHFEVTKSSGAFLITSLYQFVFSRSSNEDKLIELTFSQCDVLNALYDAIFNMWRRTKPVTYTIRASQGLGIGMNDVDRDSRIGSETPARNLRRLHNCMSDYFDSAMYRDYANELRHGGSLHDWMK